MPGILDRMACGVALALTIGGPPTEAKKRLFFEECSMLHKTSQIPSKLALGRGRFGARGWSPKKQNTRRKFAFSDFLKFFDVAFFV